MSVTTVAALPRLSLLQTVTDAFAFLLRERRRCVPSVVVFSAIFGLLQALLVHVPFPDLRLALGCLAYLAVGACLAYVWCRLILLDEWVLDGGVRTRFRWAQFSGFVYYYALICIGLATLATAAAVALAPMSGVWAGVLFSGLAFSLLVARLAFVLPAAALQLPTSFHESWIQTTGQGGRLWLIYGCTAIPTVGIVGALGLVSIILPGSVAIVFMISFAAWCAGLAGALAITTVVALAYERMVGLPERARRLDRMVGAKAGS